MLESGELPETSKVLIDEADQPNGTCNSFRNERVFYQINHRISRVRDLSAPPQLEEIHRFPGSGDSINEG
jgi:hypothetical protein